MQRDVQRVLIDRHAIAKRVEQLAATIAADFGRAEHDDPARNGQPIEITLVPILLGSVIFVSDLVRHLPNPMKIGMISVSSYPGASTSSKGARLRDTLNNLPATLKGGHVLVIDDILDSGGTLKLVTDLIRTHQPHTLKTCVFLRKNRPEAMNFPVDYVGFDIPDEFVVGYGLDYNDYYRNLPDVVTLTPEAVKRGGVFDAPPVPGTSAARAIDPRAGGGA